MKYIYDILLNWSDETNVYEFFEWQTGDDLEHIKKIPILRIGVNDFKKIHISDFILSHDICNSLYQKTELFNNKVGKSIDYACIFTDGLRAIAIEFDKNGNSIYKSHLLLDEEEEVLDIMNKMAEIKIKYKILKKKKRNIFLTRYERDIKKYLVNEFNNIYNTRNVNKLKYLYYEWYNTTCDDFDLMFNRIKKILSREWNGKHINLYNLIKLSDIKKIKKL